MANKFARALKHLKSSQFDEKIDAIIEQPTNNTQNLMTITPSVETEVATEITYLDFATGETGDDGENTSGLFLSDGTILTIEPPGDTSYVLGPMSSMWYAWGNFTRIGYIRQSDRKMVNLASISGELGDWDGTADDFTSYGQLTLAQADWFRTTTKKDGANNDTPNYRAFYPGPPSNTPDEYGRYYCVITGTPKDFPGPNKSVTSAPGQGPEDATTQFSGMLNQRNKKNIAWGGKPKGPPTKKFGGIKGRTADTDAMMSVNGMGLSPAAFEKKYGISPQEYINLPHSQSSAGGDDTQIAYGGYSIEDKINVQNYHKKLQKNPNYKPKGYELDSLHRQMKARGGSDTQIATIPSGPNSPLPSPGWTPRPGSSFRPGATWNPPKPGGGTGTYGTTIKLAQNKKKKKNGTLAANYEPQSQVLSEGRKWIREIRKSVDVPELPKKLKVKPRVRKKEGYKVVGEGLMKDQVAPPEFSSTRDNRMWRKYEMEQNKRTSQEKKNQVLEKIGEGDHQWNYMIANENWRTSEQMKKFYGTHDDLYTYYHSGKKHKIVRKEGLEKDFLLFVEDEDGIKDTILQSELNDLIAYERDQEDFKGHYLYETEQKEREINFDKVNKIKKVIGDVKRGELAPEYPKDPPPKTIDGWHPKLGKNYKHDKLDPQSAEAMPATGDPEIDANIEKATDKKAKARKTKVLAGKTEQFSNWRDELTDA